jgi:exopolysaccharide biosynthesis polyprenyl glycosylphosphotransferase
MAGSEATVVGPMAPSYLSLTVVLGVAWVVALAAVRSRHRRIVGSGPQEYTRVFSASWRLFAVVAVAAYLAKADVGRAYLAIAFPLGVGLLLLGRFGWRQWLRSRRATGRYESSMIVVGHRETAAELIGELMARPETGYRVAGVCVLDAGTPRGETVMGTPVLGGLDDLVALATDLEVDAVAVTGSDQLTASTVRRLGWDLEPTGADLVIATALTDVAGPRILMTPVNGLPLVHVDAPRFTGAKYVVKTVADWICAALLTVLLAPLLLVIAVLVRLSSPGPALFRQERIGHNGEPFRVLKFRTMHLHAEERLDDVADGDIGVFYKPRNDPRVTALGRVLRRHSLDELPQLFNVLRGEMSLVGPRPQIDREVALYDRAAARRLLVKPGLTGLWQVSGRSELALEEAIRMDVFYVENWTLFGDLIILARTAKVMLSGEGAY